MFQVKSLKIGPGKIGFIESPLKSKKFLVYLHGGYGNPTDILGLLKPLGVEGYRIIAPFLPGHGKSFKLPRNFDYQSYLKAVVEFLKKKKLKKFTLLGKSLGGRIAIDVCNSQEFIANKLILYAPMLQVEKLRFYNMVTKILFDKSLDSLNSKIQKVKSEHNNKFTSIPSLWKVVKSIDKEKPLIPPKVKTLFLWGDKDHVVPFSKYKKIINSFPNHKLVLLDGGHYCHLRSPERFTNEIIKFLTR